MGGEGCVEDGGRGGGGGGGRPASDIDQGHAQVQLVVVEDRLGGGQHLHHQVLDTHARIVHTLDDVLHRGQRPGDDVGLDFVPGTGQTHWVPDTSVAVHDKAALHEVV